jgi:adenylate cyclase
LKLFGVAPTLSIRGIANREPGVSTSIVAKDVPAAATGPDATPHTLAPDFAEWLIKQGLKLSTAGAGGEALDQLLGKICHQLAEHGLALFRVVIGVRALHPQLFGRQTIWQRGCECVTTINREHAIENSPTYLNSPARHVREGRGALRRRLEGPNAQIDYPVLEELRADGATDYIIMPMTEDFARSSYVSFASDRPGGFSAAEIETLKRLVPSLAVITELFAARRMAGDLLAVYLGRDAAKRVLDGEVRRGTGTPIRAVLWHCDLRGFTTLADVMPPDQLIALLDGYFEAMARPVGDRGGEVLKFIGDAILAIFRFDDGGEVAAAGRALAAAHEALGNLARLNEERSRAGQKPIVTKIALHTGDMMYGNVGAADRLDFTVIGPAVNTVARVQTMCAELDEPLLASRDFARLVPSHLVSRGLYRLRGLAEPTELFALKETVLQVKS